MGEKSTGSDPAIGDEEMKRIFFICSAVFLLGMSGCGYTTTSALPSRLKTIHIQPFKNSIDYTDAEDQSVYFPLLEVKAWNAVVRRFQFDGNLSVVDSPEDADLILKGELVEYRRNPLRYLDNDDVEEYRVQIVMYFVLIDTMNDEAMWEYNRFIGESTYFLTGAQASTEDSAVEEAAVDLARRIVETTIENW